MSEQFALKETGSQGTHVHGHHLRVPPSGKGVQFTCQHLLTRTVLTGDEDVGVRGRHLFHQALQLLHDPALAPVHGGFLLSVGCFACGTGGGCQRVYQSLVVPWLHYEISRSFLDAPHGQVDVCVCREQHHGQGGTEALHLVQPVEAFATVVDARAEVHVQQQYLPRLPAQHGGKSNGRGKGDDACEDRLQQELQSGEHAAVIVYDEYGVEFLHGHF